MRLSKGFVALNDSPKFGLLAGHIQIFQTRGASCQKTSEFRS